MTRLEGTETWLVQEVAFSAVGKDSFEVTLADPTFQLPNSVSDTASGSHRPPVPRRRVPRPAPVMDDRIDWQTLKGDLVTIHWQSGDIAYAERP